MDVRSYKVFNILAELLRFRKNNLSFPRTASGNPNLTKPHVIQVNPLCDTLYHHRHINNNTIIGCAFTTQHIIHYTLYIHRARRLSQWNRILWAVFVISKWYFLDVCYLLCFAIRHEGTVRFCPSYSKQLCYVYFIFWASVCWAPTRIGICHSQTATTDTFRCFLLQFLVRIMF